MEKLKLTHERGEEESTKEEDLISELPDEVLCSILSLLPMKDKVKTSILSTRWRYQWASTPYLDFDIYTMNERIINLMSPSVGKLELAIQDEKGLQVVNSEFVRYVSKILQLYRCPKIHSFMVSYLFDQLASCHLDQWIEFAIAKGVESLELNLIYPPSFFIIKEYLVLKRNLLYPPCLPCNIKGSDKWMLTPSFTIDKLFYTFPCFLLSPGGQKTTSSTLKHLHLRLCILDVPAGPSFNGFRTLVSLDLQDVKLMNAESLFSSCLLLEVLSMRKSKLPHTLEAVGPFVKNLKCLEVYGCFGVRNILVSAMKLTTFGYENAIGFGPGLFNLSLHNVPKLTRLHINIIGESTHIIPSVLTQLRKDLPHFESLFISSTIEIITQPALMLASFVNLKELELRAFIDPKSRNLLWIVSAIDVLPFLLKLHVMIYCGRSSGEERKMKTSGPPHNHLKEVLITGFNPDISYQVELLIYLLKNAVALEQMTIDPKRRYYCTDFRKKELVSSIYSPAWDERQTNKFYEALHKEVPGSASLVTVCNH